VRRPFRRWALAGVAWGVAAIGACTELEEIELGQCGNGVLEEGEDCDGYAQAPNASLCIAAGAPGACRYGCGGELVCPDGYGCGNDDVCRRHSGRFAAPEPTGQPPGRWLGAGDIDGDGNDDLVNLYPTQLGVDFLEDGVYQETYRLPIEARAVPLVTSLDADAFADVLVPTALGLAVWRGSATRRLMPTTYASLPVTLQVAFDFVPVDVVPEVAQLGDDLMGFPGDEPLTLTEFGAFMLPGTTIYGLLDDVIDDHAYSFPMQRAAGYAVAARFDETEDLHGSYRESPEQLAFGIRTPGEVRVMRPSYTPEMTPPGTVKYFVQAPTEANDNDPPVPASHPRHTKVELPGATLERSALPLSLNAPGASAIESRIVCSDEPPVVHAPADAHVDMLLFAMTDAGPRVMATFGLGDGSFHSDPCELAEVEAGTIVADNEAAVVAGWSQCLVGSRGWPLAAAELDGDGVVDFVMPEAVRLSGRVPESQRDALGLCDAITAVPHPDAGKFWVEAVTGDFNGDGRTDVMAAAREAGLDLLTSAPDSHLNHLRLATAAAAEKLTSGDYDGNGVSDVAFVERLGGRDVISVVFGEQGALPGVAVQVGSLEDVLQMLSLDLAPPGDPETIDASDELLVSSGSQEDLRFALLYGRQDRQLQAPFSFGVDVALGAGERYDPVGVAVARFGFDCGSDAAPEREGLAMALTGLGAGEASMGGLPRDIFGMACVDDDAQFTALGDDASAMDLPDSDAVLRTAVVAVEMADGVPDPVVVLWDAAEPRLELAAPTASPDVEWSLGERARFDGALPAGARLGDAQAARSLLWSWTGELSAPPQTCRLRAGEAESLLVLAAHEAGTCPDGSAAAAMVLHVVPAEALEAMRASGALDGDQEITGEDGATILGVACLNADDDADEEIMLLLLDGPDPQCGEEGARTARLALVEADASGALAAPVTVATFDRSQIPSLEGVVGAQPPVAGITVGDFDGDGVDDLALAATPSTQVLLGEARNP
jgi:hypothetical protein